MRKLNRKGFLTIEVVLASVMTFIIAFFLIDLTIKLVNTTDDAYIDTLLITDKALVIKNLKNTIQSDICDYNGIYNAYCLDDSLCTIMYLKNAEIAESFDDSYFPIYGQILIESNTIKYIRSVHGVETVVYEKKLSDYFGNAKINGQLDYISNTNDDSDYYSYLNFMVYGENIFLDENYNINVFMYNGC